MINRLEKVYVNVFCPRCLNGFQYGGSAIYSTRCPKCRKVIRLRGLK